MSAEDLEIWRRWWPGAQGDALRIYFDVGLGLPDELPRTEDANQLLGWIRNTQKRADVVVERRARVDVVELRFNASLNVVGRLLGYIHLLNQDNPFNLPLRGVIVTNRFDSEVEAVAEVAGFTFLVV